MAIKEERPNYRKSRSEKQHVKRWGNAVLVLLLITVLGGIYAYLRYDGLQIDAVFNNQNSQNRSNNGQPAAKYDFIEELRSGSGSIFDDIEPEAQPTEVSTPPETPVASQPAENTATIPAMVSLDGNPDHQASTPQAPAENTSPAPTDTTPAVVQPIAPPPVATNQSGTALPTPFQAAPTTSSQPKPNAAVTAVAAQPAPQPQQQPVVTTTAPPAVSAAQPEPTPPKPQPAKPAEPAPQTVAAAPAKPETPTAPPTTSAAPSNEGSGMLFQLGSYRERGNAETMRANLAFMGINSRILNERGLHIVVTDAKSGTARQQLEQRLQQQGVSYFKRR